MKTLLFLAIFVAAAATVSAQDTTASFTATNRQTRTTTRSQTVETRTVTPVGALPRAAQGNPLQMINPSAPARYYGPPEETVVRAPYTSETHRRQREQPEYAGVVLLGWRW